MSVGDGQFLQGERAFDQVRTFFGVGDETGLGVFADRADGGHDVGVVLDDFLDRFEVVMLGEGDAFRREHQGVSAVAVHLGESAIDGHGIASLLDGQFALFRLDRDVAVDDERVGRGRLPFPRRCGG